MINRSQLLRMIGSEAVTGEVSEDCKDYVSLPESIVHRDYDVDRRNVGMDNSGEGFFFFAPYLLRQSDGSTKWVTD